MTSIEIPIPDPEIMSAIAGILAFFWTMFQEYRHKIKHGENIRFKKGKRLREEAQEDASFETLHQKRGGGLM